MSIPRGQRLNARFDRFVRPALSFRNRAWSAFHVCGLTGLAAAIGLSMVLIGQLGLSRWIMAAIVVTAVATFFGLTLLTKILSGQERLVYYHHEIAVLGTTTLLLWVMRQPIAPYLDVTILGVGTFLVCGRVGCLMAGCCFGRPYPWGICYGEAHAGHGFPAHYVGVRLFPVQALESLLALAVVLAGSALIVRGHPAGSALALYVVVYGMGRFLLEFLRGDAVRPYVGGFSEAQWTSLLLMGALVGAETADRLPFQPSHAAALASVALTMLGISLYRRADPLGKHQLLTPKHRREIARIVSQARQTQPLGGTVTTLLAARHIQVTTTSLGIQISTGQIAGREAPVDHYAFSLQREPLRADAARQIAALLTALHAPGSEHELVCGSRGIYHLFVRRSR